MTVTTSTGRSKCIGESAGPEHGPTVLLQAEHGWQIWQIALCDSQGRWKPQITPAPVPTAAMPKLSLGSRCVLHKHLQDALAALFSHWIEAPPKERKERLRAMPGVRAQLLAEFDAGPMQRCHVAVLLVSCRATEERWAFLVCREHGASMKGGLTLPAYRSLCPFLEHGVCVQAQQYDAVSARLQESLPELTDAISAAACCGARALVCTGHSVGGAHATLLVTMLRLRIGHIQQCQLSEQGAQLLASAHAATFAAPVVFSSASLSAQDKRTTFSQEFLTVSQGAYNFLLAKAQVDGAPLHDAPHSTRGVSHCSFGSPCISSIMLPWHCEPDHSSDEYMRAMLASGFCLD